MNRIISTTYNGDTTGRVQCSFIRTPPKRREDGMLASWILTVMIQTMPDNNEPATVLELSIDCGGWVPQIEGVDFT